MEECPHGMGEPAWCTICNGRDKQEKAEADVVAYRFAAKFDGHCYGCGQPTLTGEQIAATRDGRYLCETCAPE